MVPRGRGRLCWTTRSSRHPLYRLIEWLPLLIRYDMHIIDLAVQYRTPRLTGWRFRLNDKFGSANFEHRAGELAKESPVVLLSFIQTRTQRNCYMESLSITMQFCFCREIIGELIRGFVGRDLLYHEAISHSEHTVGHRAVPCSFSIQETIETATMSC